MTNTSIIKKAVITSDDRLVIISQITSAISSITKPQNTLLVNSYRTLHGSNNHLDLTNRRELSGDNSQLEYHDMFVLTDTGDDYNYQIIICGIDKNRLEHDPDRLFVYVLDRQLNVVQLMFRYVHESHVRYKISKHIISDDKRLIRIVRAIDSVTEFEFYLNN